MDKVLTIVLAGVLLALTVCFFSLLMALPVKWTWNTVMPYLFGFKEIGWGQAWCLLFLSGMLLKSSCSSSSSESK